MTSQVSGRQREGGDFSLLNHSLLCKGLISGGGGGEGGGRGRERGGRERETKTLLQVRLRLRNPHCAFAPEYDYAQPNSLYITSLAPHLD